MGPRNNGICPECMRSIKVNVDGFLGYHGPGHGKGHCPGSSGRPLERPSPEIEEPLDLVPCEACGKPSYRPPPWGLPAECSECKVRRLARAAGIERKLFGRRT